MAPMHRRRRAIRPGSQLFLMTITWILTVIVWVCWEVGRVLTRIQWWRAVVALTSGLTLVLFAIGDYLR